MKKLKLNKITKCSLCKTKKECKIVDINYYCRECCNKLFPKLHFDYINKTRFINGERNEVTYALYLDGNFYVAVASRGELILTEKFPWAHPPIIGMDVHDHHKACVILEKLINKVKATNDI